MVRLAGAAVDPHSHQEIVPDADRNFHLVKTFVDYAMKTRGKYDQRT
jgi:hypothetical protein